MTEISLEIQRKRIRKVHIDISQNLSNGFQLKVESKVQIKTPKVEEDKTALVLMETNISIPDSDDFDITMSAEFLFKFDEILDDYKSVAEERCIPLVQEDLFKSLDNILVEMGFNRLNLAEK